MKRSSKTPLPAAKRVKTTDQESLTVVEQHFQLARRGEPFLDGSERYPDEETTYRVHLARWYTREELAEHLDDKTRWCRVPGRPELITPFVIRHPLGLTHWAMRTGRDEESVIMRWTTPTPEHRKNMELITAMIMPESETNPTPPTPEKTADQLIADYVAWIPTHTRELVDPDNGTVYYKMFLD